MRIIKRYDNRKLYDTETSKTITLKEIAILIRDGNEIKVVDATDKDITNKVMAQIFLQESLETKQLVFSKFLLEWLIKESGKLEEFTKKLLLGGVGLASQTQEKAEQIVNELIKRGELDETERAKFVKQLIGKVEKGSKDFKHMVEGFVQEVTTKEKQEMKSEEDVIAEKEKEIADLKKQIKEMSKEEVKVEHKEEEKNIKKQLKVG